MLVLTLDFTLMRIFSYLFDTYLHFLVHFSRVEAASSAFNNVAKVSETASKSKETIELMNFNNLLSVLRGPSTISL